MSGRRAVIIRMAQNTTRQRLIERVQVKPAREKEAEDGEMPGPLADGSDLVLHPERVALKGGCRIHDDRAHG